MTIVGSEDRKAHTSDSPEPAPELAPGASLPAGPGTGARRRASAPRIIRVVGASQSGKTSLIERLLPALKARGLVVAAVKHAPHGFDSGRPGSDSARLARAGARSVLVAGPEHCALWVSGSTAPLQDLVARHLRDADLVLAEGFSSEPGPVVVVHRRGVPAKVLPHRDQVVAAVTDEPLGYELEIGPGDIGSIADVLAGLAPAGRDPLVTLVVDGRPVPLNDFVTGMLTGGLLGMLGALKGVSDEARRIDLSVRLSDGGGSESG